MQLGRIWAAPLLCAESGQEVGGEQLGLGLPHSSFIQPFWGSHLDTNRGVPFVEVSFGVAFVLGVFYMECPPCVLCGGIRSFCFTCHCQKPLLPGVGRNGDQPLYRLPLYVICPCDAWSVLHAVSRGRRIVCAMRRVPVCLREGDVASGAFLSISSIFCFFRVHFEVWSPKSRNSRDKKYIYIKHKTVKPHAHNIPLCCLRTIVVRAWCGRAGAQACRLAGLQACRRVSGRAFMCE